jgi:hypothetical protein
MPAELPAPAPPQHPLPALTTFELRDYRSALEQTIDRLGQCDPVPPARAGLQARLDAVLAEQDSRTRLARHRQARS